MNSDQARQQAEKSFKKEERAQDARKAMMECECQALATREKTARLRELRSCPSRDVRYEPHAGIATAFLTVEDFVI